MKLVSRSTDEDLIFVLASRLRMDPKQAAEVMDKVADSIRKCIVENEALHIRKLGVFFLKKRKPAKVKNFKDEEATVPSFYMIRFKPSVSLKDKVNKEMSTKVKIDS